MSRQYIIDAMGNRVAIILDLNTYVRLLERSLAPQSSLSIRDLEERQAAGELSLDEQELLTLWQGINAQAEDLPANASVRSPSGATFVALLDTMTFDPDRLAAMERAIEEDCERRI